MGIKDMPCEKMNSQRCLGGAFCLCDISRTQFWQIKRCLSVALPSQEANMTDKLAKTRPLIDMFSAITWKYYIPEQNLALDESQILCCARKTRVAHREDKHDIKPLKDYFESFGLHESGTGYCLSFAIDERSSLTTKDYISRLSWYIDSLCPLSYISIFVALYLSILNIFFSRSDKFTSILIWYQDILYLRHERVTEKMKIMVSPTLQRIHLFQREIVKGSVAETLEIPLLSSVSSPVRVLTLYMPIIAILDIWKTTLFYEGESVVYDRFKYVWPIKG